MLPTAARLAVSSDDRCSFTLHRYYYNASTGESRWAPPAGWSRRATASVANMSLTGLEQAECGHIVERSTKFCGECGARVVFPTVDSVPELCQNEECESTNQEVVACCAEEV